MIKIKDYIFNENEIDYIKSGTTFKENSTPLLVKTNGLNVKTKKKDLLFEDATLENDYGTCELENSKLRSEIIELKEENKRLSKNQRYYKNGVFSLENDKETMSDMIDDYKSRIDKAIEYIEEHVAVCAFGNKALPHWEFDDDNIQDLLKILKGEYDERRKTRC